MNIIYTILCGIFGAVLATENISPKKWKFWVLLGCMLGAYLCGKCF